MTELRTMKDIDGDISSKDLTVNQTKIEIFHELKQEAIKWAKEIQKPYRELESKYFANFQARDTINWIKHFFNITDEELK